VEYQGQAHEAGIDQIKHGEYGPYALSVERGRVKIAFRALGQGGAGEDKKEADADLAQHGVVPDQQEIGGDQPFRPHVVVKQDDCQVGDNANEVEVEKSVVLPLRFRLGGSLVGS